MAGVGPREAVWDWQGFTAEDSAGEARAIGGRKGVFVGTDGIIFAIDMGLSLTFGPDTDENAADSYLARCFEVVREILQEMIGRSKMDHIGIVLFGTVSSPILMPSPHLARAGTTQEHA